MSLSVHQPVPSATQQQHQQPCGGGDAEILPPHCNGCENGRGNGSSDGEETANHNSTTTTSTPDDDNVVVDDWMFGVAGLLNNAPYVIMLSMAKSIAEGGVALVYLANIVPGLLIKLSAPYWFHFISYRHRLRLASCLMCLAFVTVAFFSASSSERQEPQRQTASSSTTWTLLGQLVGVAMISAQTALGEASLLALAGTHARHRLRHHHSINNNNDETGSSARASSSLTYFASGTGMAGPMGYLWTMLFVRALGWNLQSTCLLAAIVLAGSYSMVTLLLTTTLATSTTTTTTRTIEGSNNLQQEQEVQLGAEEECVPMMMMLEASTRTCSSSTHASSTLSVSSSSSDPQMQDANRHSTTTRRTRRDDDDHDGDDDDDEASALVSFQATLEQATESELQPPRPNVGANEEHGSRDDHDDDEEDDEDVMSTSLRMPIAAMTTRQRSRMVLGLWPYMIPLFVVYAAEYACQGGAWTAIGFPTVTSTANRNTFYTNANWLYQAGVFVSRSSGNLFTLSLPMLWFLPAWQVCHFLLFTWTAAHGVNHSDETDTGGSRDDNDEDVSSSSSFFLYKASILYTLAFCTGLLGGAVYVHGYQRIVADYSSPPSLSLSLSSYPHRHRRRRGDDGHAEYALASASVAESFGILVANMISLVLQACLYQINHLPGAMATCPVATSS